MTSTSKKITAAIFAIMGALLAGCGLQALPDEERYAYINSLKEDSGYATAGKALEEGYDKADGVFSTSFWEAKIQGKDVYEKNRK